MAVEFGDVLPRQFERRAEIGIDAAERGVDLTCGYLEGIELRPVELFGVAVEGDIALGAHRGDDRVHGSVHVALGANVAAEDLLRGDFR